MPDRASEPAREGIGRHLAREVGGDPLAADPHAWGQPARRLHQPARSGTRRWPKALRVALLRGASGRAAPEGPALLREAEKALGERSRESERTSEPAVPPRPHSPEAIALFRETLEELRRYGMDDPDRRDLAAARKLAEAGFQAETIEQALRAASPELEKRKGRDLQDYIRGTLSLALESRERSPERTRGRSDLER